MTPAENGTQTAPQKIEADRPSFDETLVKETEKFTESIMRAVPELAGMAIIPIWTNPADGLPPGTMRVRNPQEPPMPFLLQLLQNMCKFSMLVDKELVSHYRYFNGKAQELAQHVDELLRKEAQLNSANNQSGD